MDPEIWVGLVAVFVAGGAIGTAGTLLTQWILRKIEGERPGALDGPEYGVLRREVAELGRQMRNVDARLDFAEQLLGGALSLAPPPTRFEPRDPEAESDASDEPSEIDGGDGAAEEVR